MSRGALGAALVASGNPAFQAVHAIKPSRVLTDGETCAVTEEYNLRGALDHVLHLARPGLVSQFASDGVERAAWLQGWADSHSDSVYMTTDPSGAFQIRRRIDHVVVARWETAVAS